MKNVPLAGAVFNLSGGICILFFLDFFGPLLNMDPSANMVFRLFVGGTAVVFGIGYINVFRDPKGYMSVLQHGAALKAWAFLISLYCFFQHDLSLLMLFGFGLTNLIFAMLFVIYIFKNKNVPVKQES